MKTNLLSETWTNLDCFELMHLLYTRIGYPGQYDGLLPNKLYLPLADSTCRIVLNFRDKKIVAIEPGPAFNADEWEQVSEEIEKSIVNGLWKLGREYSFSSFRVQGSWRGDRSGVQILPPPDDAPRADVEMAEHPFILEFPIKASDLWPITNHRRLQEHRNLTLLLNVLLAGRTSLQPRRPKHFWASVPLDNNDPEIKWVQQFFFPKSGKAVIDEFSLPASEHLEQVGPEEYYTKVGHDGKGLRVPTDLDPSICSYTALSAGNRVKFDRATFWMDIASRQWHISVSASFAALVSAIESLTERGDSHKFDCPICGKRAQHEVPGPTRRFKDFFDIYAPGATLKKRRDDMYSLRSDILHGSYLMQLDQDRASGWDPPWWNEYELHTELWSLTRIALRNWLKNPPAT
jgi:hypothetical protein